MRKLGTVVAAIKYIETHLTSDRIDLETMAEAVHYSKYHLHRLFRETVGLSIHDYARRRRLTEAAKLLVFSDKPILEIALLAGYDRQQTFGKVFKAMYKQTPHQFRRNQVFYPLQLEFNFGAPADKRKHPANGEGREIRPAGEADIAGWMALVRLAVDGFPHLAEDEHLATLKRYIEKGRALIMTEKGQVIGGMLITPETGSIDFLAVHPLYRRQGLTREFLELALTELLKKREVSITTFREGDQADTGYRRDLQELGFAEAELLTEFGYPTQKMVLTREAEND